VSKFKSYAERVNEIARAAFANYIEAAGKQEIAEARYKEETSPYKDPAHNDYKQQAKAARAKAEMLDAQQEVRNAQKFLFEEAASIRAVGRELQEAVNREYSAKGEEVDLATLELLKSGILKPQEYFTLYETAQGNGNNTMCRLIGKYAGEAAENAPTNELQARLIALANAAQQTGGRAFIDAFSMLEDAYNRTANNPAMISSWGKITDSIIANF